MIKTSIKFAPLLLGVLVASSLANAEESPGPASVPESGAGSSKVTISQPSTAAPAFQKVDITYFGIYQGPSFGTANQSYQINPSTNSIDTGWPQVLENQIKANVNITENVFVGPVLNFYFFPGQTDNSIIQDSGVRVGNKHLIKSGGFNVSADLRFLGPIAPGDVKNNASILYESIENITYAIPKSKWTVGLLGFNKYHSYVDQGLGHLDADLYWAPNFSWQFSQKLALTNYVEFYPAHKIGNEGWTVTQPMDINPGINWDVTETFSVNPGIVFYPTSPNIASTSAIVYISDKLL